MKLVCVLPSSLRAPLGLSNGLVLVLVVLLLFPAPQVSAFLATRTPPVPSSVKRKSYGALIVGPQRIGDFTDGTTDTVVAPTTALGVATTPLTPSSRSQGPSSWRRWTKGGVQKQEEQDHDQMIPPTTTSKTATILQELEQVEINALSLAGTATNEKGNFYMTFSQTPRTTEDFSFRLFKSMDFKPKGTCEACVSQLVAHVNLHLRNDHVHDQEHGGDERTSSLLKCSLYQKRPGFLPDRLVGVGELPLDSLFSNNNVAESVHTHSVTFHDPHTGKPLISQEKSKNNGNDEAKMSMLFRCRHWDGDYHANNRDGGDENVELFFHMYRFFLGLLTKIYKYVPASKIGLPHQAADPNLKMQKMFGPLSYPMEDEFDPMPAWQDWFVRLIAMCFRKDQELFTRYDNRIHGIFDIRKQLEERLPAPIEGAWDNPTSDKAMTRVFFSNTGQFHGLTSDPNSDGGYVSDTTFLSTLKYRKGYEPYGVRTFFDKHGAILRIEDPDGTTYCPGDQHWEWAKLKSRTSAFTMTNLHHICTHHQVWAGTPCVALRMFLPPDHPIRRVFSIHFFRTAYINRLAGMVLSHGAGILSKGLSMTFEGGLERSLIKFTEDFRFQPWPKVIKERGLDNCDFLVVGTDGVDLHAVLSRYVSGFLDTVYDSEEALLKDTAVKQMYDYFVTKWPGVPVGLTLANLKTLWSEILFQVTGLHTGVGQVITVGLDPAFTNLRQQQGAKPNDHEDLIAPQESCITMAWINARTKVKHPKLGDDFSHIFQGEEELSVYHRLQSDLDQLRSVVDERNQHRPRNIDFHPDYTNISTGT